jgi:hypothetical protein
VAKKKTVTRKPVKGAKAQKAAVSSGVVRLYSLGAGALEIRKFTNGGALADPDTLPPHFVVQGLVKGQALGGQVCALVLMPQLPFGTVPPMGAPPAGTLLKGCPGTLGGPTASGGTSFSIDVDLTGQFDPGTGPVPLLLRVEYNVGGPASSCLPQETDITVVF